MKEAIGNAKLSMNAGIPGPFLLAAALFSAAGYTPAEAADPGGQMAAESSALERHIEAALRNHPGLKARQSEHQAAKEKVRQAGSLPDPQVSLGLFPLPMERYMGDQVLSASLMQMFPWIGTLGAARDEAAAMAAMKEEAFREARNRLVLDVKESWYSLYLAAREIRATRESLDILKTLKNIAVIRFGSGESGRGGSAAPPRKGSGSGMSPGGPSAGSGTVDGMGAMGGMGGKPGESSPGGRPMDPGSMEEMGAMGGPGFADVLRVQMEIQELEERLASLEDALRIAIVRCNRLLNRPADHPLSPAETLLPLSAPASDSVMREAMRANNPMLRMLASEERAFGFQEKMNRRMGYPMVGLGLQYEYLRERGGPDPAHGGNMLMPMVSLSLPVWRGKYAGAVREAAHMREAAAKAREDAELELRLRFEEARRELDGAARRRALFSGQVDLAQRALDVLTAGYASAGGDFEEVLRMQQRLLDYRLQLLRAIVDNNLAVARLEWLMGVES